MDLRCSEVACLYVVSENAARLAAREGRRGSPQQSWVAPDGGSVCAIEFGGASLENPEPAPRSARDARSLASRGHALYISVLIAVPCDAKLRDQMAIPCRT